MIRASLSGSFLVYLAVGICGFSISTVFLTNVNVSGALKLRGRGLGPHDRLHPVLTGLKYCRTRARPAEIHIPARNTKSIVKDAGFSREKYTTAAVRADISRQ